jgi:secondary thiamine-phosphate synthase enzyme
MQFKIHTSKQQQFIDITGKVAGAVADGGVQNGIAVVYVTHTTSGVKINENADPLKKKIDKYADF